MTSPGDRRRPTTRSEERLPTPPAAPHAVGPYLLAGEIGRGGMGVVYRAHAPDGTPVALKVLSRRAGADLGSRFAREASLRLVHPNVVQLLDSGVDPDGTPYIAFELLEGESLAERFRHGRLSPPEVVDVGLQVLAGLGAAHARGVVHRDLKPANLFRCHDGTVKILDFGVARIMGDESRVTRTGAVVGTPAYVAPEQAKGEESLDGRADLWALGAVLYEALAKSPPYLRDTPVATLVALVMESVPPLEELAPETPPDLVRVIERALRKSREERWPTAAAFAAALAAADLTPSAADTPTSVDLLPAILPGERRIVSVVLATGVTHGEAMKQEVRRRGGLFLPLYGQRAIGLFGGALWEGDEVERAAEAALAATAWAERLAVASGHATADGSGLSGQVITQAERTLEGAGAGVWIDPACAPLLTGFALEPGEGRLRLGARSAEREVERARPDGEQVRPLIGREVELAQLGRAAQAVLVEERAVVVLIHGPGGIGKSRLLEEVELRHAHLLEELSPLGAATPRWLRLAARARPDRKHVAWALLAALVEGAARELAVEAGLSWDGPAGHEERPAVLALLARYAGCDPGAPGFLGELLAVPMPPSDGLQAARLDPRLMADRLRLAGRELVLGLAARAGLTLLLEDLQWADDDSLSLLEELAERLQDRRLLLVATGRPELLERQPTPFAGGKVLQIEPQGLLLPDVGRLATLVAGRPLPPELVRSIAERTQGSPLFVEHIVLALPEVRRAGEGPSALPLPLTVEAAVQSRLDHLPYEEREILKRAALLRRPFLAEEIEALGADDAEAGLAALVRRDLVSFKSGERQDRRRRYRIKSVLVADVAYLMMARPLRADLHRRAAQYLADRQSAGPEELAVHYERGGEQVQAARAYTRAALNAAARGDSAGVLRNGDRALALGVEPGVLFGLRMARAEALRFLGRREEQKLELEAALARARTEAERAFALAEQSWWLAAHGQAAEALAHAETAVSAARACGDATVLARALGRQVVALIHTGQLDAAGHCLSEATRLTADASLQLRALAQGWRAQLATAKGDLGERRDAFQTACWLYQRAGDVRSAAGAEANLADVHNRLGAYGEAEVALAHAIEGCRRVGHREMEAYAHLNRAYALAMLARHGEAAGSLEQARAIADPLGKRRLSVAVALYAAKLSLLSARTGSAAAEAEAAERSAASAALPALAVSARVVRAQAYLSQGSASEARALAEQALAERDRLGGLEEDDAELFLVLSRALDALGLPREARRIARRGEQALEAVALGISDASLREQYRNGVAAHRALVDRAAQG